MKLTIIRSDNCVYVDGVPVHVDCSSLAADVHAVQWDDATGRGWVEYTPKQPDVLTTRDAYQPLVDAWTAEKARLDQLAAEAAAKAAADAAAKEAAAQSAQTQTAPADQPTVI